MKVLLVSAWFPFPPANGVRLRAYHLLRELARSHRVTLLTFAHDSDQPAAHMSALERHCAHVQVVPGSPVMGRRERPTDWFTAMPRALAASRSPAMQAAVDAVLDDHDVAIGLTQWSAPYLMDRRSKPRILDELELTMLAENRRVSGLAGIRHRLTWWKQARFVRYLAADFDRITVVSECERAMVGATGCDLSRVSIVPNAVPRDLLERPITAPMPGRLIYTGSVTYGPNRDAVRWLITEILPRLQVGRPGLALYVTGSTEGVPIADMANRPGVVFTGQVADVQSAIAASAVCVVPLRAGGGTRLKVLEALALGVPVVTTPKGAEGLGVDDEREVLFASTPEAFAERIGRALDDQDLRQRLIAAGRQLVAERFTWDIAGAALGCVLEDACSSWAKRQ